MRLVADGRVELDAPARRYVPEPMLADEPTAAHVTVLNLLEPPPGEYGGCRPHASRALSQCSRVWSLGRRRRLPLH